MENVENNTVLNFTYYWVSIISRSLWISFTYVAIVVGIIQFTRFLRDLYMRIVYNKRFAWCENDEIYKEV